MSYQALARKWRPRRFADLAGQEHVVRALTHALERQTLHHAYLFTGTRGVGKTTIARILAKSLNCETGITATPCGTCAACREIDDGRFVDLLELDAASNTGVDSMREVLDNAQYAPTTGRFKVYIIDEVHMLSKAAFNSMLKTLEEPPEHVKFILATTDPQKIPVTVLSRCLQFGLKHLPPALIVGHLEHILRAEGVACDNAALPLLARGAQGSMRDALSLLDQAIAYGNGQVSEAAVRGMLGTASGSYLFDVLRALGAQDGKSLLDLADEMAARNVSFDAALQELGVLLHQIALAQVVPEALAEDVSERDQVLALAQQLSPETVQLYYQIAALGRRDLGLAPDEFAGFTMTLLRMLAFAPDTGGVPRASRADARRPDEPSAAPVRAVPERAQRASTVAAHAMDGDVLLPSGAEWHALVAKLRLVGMAKMLAQHCELKSSDGVRLALCVPEAHKHLLEKAYQERLLNALREQLGDRVQVEFSVGTVTGEIPARIEQKVKEQRQAEAAAAIQGDPFVRELVENFDGRLIESTIKPVASKSADGKGEQTC
ncbi:MAG: DNA polymerase III subunit gamma/tau [Betaproteobacteria bacterium]|nr:DNA polymerase III subunit gamma/tau [Betaproteobacteria bacterium]